MASAAWAVQPTQLSLGLPAAPVGKPAILWAIFTPTKVEGGTVSFTSDGVPIETCQSIAVHDGRASCETVFRVKGSHTIGASYTGTEFWAASKAMPARINVVGLDAWIYIVKDPEEPVYGQGLIISALALGAANGPFPTGTFTFSDNGQTLVTRPVREDRSLWDEQKIPGARAFLEMPLAAGEHRIKAEYNGDDTYRGAWPATLIFTLGKGKPVVAISSTPAQIGQPVVVTASVTARNPTGTIAFQGIPQCSRVALDSSGFAQCPTVFSQLGEYDVSASYSGDANLEPGSAAMKVKVTKAIPGFYVAASEGSAVAGQPVRLSALVVGAPNLPRPLGSVTFTSDVTPATGEVTINAEGRATWLAPFSAGAQRVTAEFKGDGSHAGAIRPTTFLVGRANTTTVVSAPAGGPFSATVKVAAPGGGTPTGAVRFLRDGVSIGTAQLVQSTATLVATGSGDIAAEYVGDNNYFGSSSIATAAPPKAMVMLSSDRNPVAAGQSVTLTVVVMPNPGTRVPSGSIRFTADGVALGEAALAGGRAEFSVTLAPGSHRVEAAYSGDAIYPAVSGTIEQVVTGSQSSMGLSASVAGPVAGQPLSLTVQLAADRAGTVRFLDGATVLGSASLSGGRATLAVPGLAAGAHNITAVCSGDAVYAAATAEISLTVARASTSTALTLGTGAASARVSVTAPGAGAPSGTVQFVHPKTGVPWASAALVNGVAAVVLPKDAALVAAVYSGDGNFAGSASEPASALAVLNSASYAMGTVAADEIVSLFGPIPAGLAKVQITDSAGATRDGRVLFSAAGQAAVVLPPTLAPGPATLIAGEWQALVTVAPAAPGLYTADASGKGPPAGLTDPIEVGEDGAVIVLYGTGFRHAPATPVCLVAGEPVEVLYAGAQAEFPGLDQLNVRIPPALRGAGAVVLELKADGAASNRVMLTIR